MSPGEWPAAMNRSIGVFQRKRLSRLSLIIYSYSKPPIHHPPTRHLQVLPEQKCLKASTIRHQTGAGLQQDHHPEPSLKLFFHDFQPLQLASFSSRVPCRLTGRFGRTSKNPFRETQEIPKIKQPWEKFPNVCPRQ